MRKAMVRDSDGYVVNVIEIEKGADWQLPPEHSLIDAGDGSPGDTWDGVQFIKPPVEPTIDWQAEWQAAKVNGKIVKQIKVIARRLGLED